MDSPQGLAAVESPTTRLRLTSTKTGRAPISGFARPPASTAAARPVSPASPTSPPSRALLAMRCGEAGGSTRRRGRARAGVVVRVQPRRAGNVEHREAVAGGVVAPARAVALRAALPANGPGLAAEPLARGTTPNRAASTLGAGLAGIRGRAQLVTESDRRPAGIARAAAAPDAAS